ncbi:amyloid-beta A4 precursor protein-binding family A member 3-like [Polyodon spathula]|uniref:amyloid-beta A4 precursor protein-binding family A member 3-like n=1 Tax=Polyodon spathula TaxID=7913 RepID=UPI001B7EB5C3|nr:amyloid-beta A4 precursor protein-binding family A member 3-like [Polyodon spathula]XP_041085651.1 amyloid-beta A4 precursor protein-binding family A member 3-like [Polyodon spathula]
MDLHLDGFLAQGIVAPDTMVDEYQCEIIAGRNLGLGSQPPEEEARTDETGSPLPETSPPAAEESSARSLRNNLCNPAGDAEESDSFSLIEPPPLDWSESGSLDSSTDSVGCSVLEADRGGISLKAEMDLLPDQFSQLEPLPDLGLDLSGTVATDLHRGGLQQSNDEQEDRLAGCEEELDTSGDYKLEDEDHSQIQVLLARLQTYSQPPATRSLSHFPSVGERVDSAVEDLVSSVALSGRLEARDCNPQRDRNSGLLFSEANQRDLLNLLDDGGLEEERVAREERAPPPAQYKAQGSEVDSVVSITYGEADGGFGERHEKNSLGHGQPAGAEVSMYPCSPEELLEPVWMKTGNSSMPEEEQQQQQAQAEETSSKNCPAYKEVPGPCDPEDLLDGVIFGAKYLGSTRLLSVKNPSTSTRMAQAQEAVDMIKAPEGESQPMTEVDLFISTKRIKVLSADTQEAMMDHSLQSISYIADIGSILVLMARRKLPGRRAAEGDGEREASCSPAQKKCCMICHAFHSEDAQLMAQAIGQAFSVAYQQFLQVNGIKPSELQPSEYSDYLGTQELYNGDLVHFSRSENIRQVCIEKTRGEILGLAIVESGWGSILPTVVVANLLHGGAAERCGELSIGDRVMSVNGTSLVGLPITTCQSIIRDLKNQTEVKLSIVHCPPVTMAIIKRPDPKYQLGFSVEDGIICSLMRGGIAERGGIRVGHRIIEINEQSVVATPHEKIIHILTHAVGEIHLKTMPASTYRLLTGQEQPLFL